MGPSPQQHNPALMNSGLTLRAPLEPSCGLSNRLVSGGMTVSNTTPAKSTELDPAGPDFSAKVLSSTLTQSHLRSSALAGQSLVASTRLAAGSSLIGHAAAVATQPGAVSHVVNNTLVTSRGGVGVGVGAASTSLTPPAHMLEIHAKYGHAASHIKGRTTGVEMPKERLTSSEWQLLPFILVCATATISLSSQLKPISSIPTYTRTHSSDHITFRPREPLEVCSASKATTDDSVLSSQRAATADRVDELLEPGVHRTPPEDTVRLPAVRVHPPRGVNRTDSGGNIDSGESAEFYNVGVATQNSTQLFVSVPSITLIV